MADLSLVPVEELVEELQSRFDTSIFGGLRNQGELAGNCYFFRGTWTEVIGLCAILQDDALRERNAVDRADMDIPPGRDLFEG